MYLGAARGVESARRDATFFRLCGIRRQIGVPVTEEMQANLVCEADVRGALEPEACAAGAELAELGEARLDDAGELGAAADGGGAGAGGGGAGGRWRDGRCWR